MEIGDISVFRISKSNGKQRVIYAPSQELKRRLRALVPQLNLLAEKLDVHRCEHGFTEGRSPVTNASAHIGWPYTVSLDISEFFPHVTKAMVVKAAEGCKLPDIEECFVDGVAQQGLPTSPALANIAVAPMCNAIWVAFCQKGRFADPPAAFTIYADDLSISCRKEETVDLILQEVPRIVEEYGFHLNPNKTRVQCAKAGRRMITGIAVGEHDIALPRETRRRLRAANHQDTAGLKRRNVRRLLLNRHRWTKRLPLRLRFYWQMKGLREWSKLKLPKQQRQPVNVVVRAAARVVTAIAGQGTCNRLFGALGIRKFG